MTTRGATIGVVGLDDGPEAGWGPAVLACLPVGTRRIGIALHHAENGAYRADLLDDVARIAPPAGDGAAFVAALAAAAAAHGMSALIPGTVALVAVLAAAAPALRKAGVAVVAPDAARLPSCWAGGLPALAHKHRLPVARLWELPAGLLAAGVPFDLGYPLPLVADDATRTRAGDAVGVADFAAAARLRGALRVMALGVDVTRLAEVAVVPAPAATGARPVARPAAKTAVALAAVAAVAAVRVLADDDRGRPWLAVTIQSPALAALAQAFVSAARPGGPVVLTVAHQHADTWSLVDVRPGFPMWCEAALAAGVDLVGAALAGAVGFSSARKPAIAAARRKPAAATAGILFSQTAEDLLVDLAQPVRLSKPASPPVPSPAKER